MQRDGLLELLKQATESNVRKSDYNTFGTHQSRHDTEMAENDPINLYVLLSDFKSNNEQKSRENMRLLDQIKSLEQTNEKLKQDMSSKFTKQSNLEKQMVFYQD